MSAISKAIPSTNIVVDELPVHDVPEVRCIAIIWARHASQQNVNHRILDDLRETNGVQRAVFSREKPDLLVVDYDPRHVRIAAILDAVNRPGVSALVVGC
jgi:hypothetical protein